MSISFAQPIEGVFVGAVDHAEDAHLDEQKVESYERAHELKDGVALTKKYPTSERFDEE